MMHNDECQAMHKIPFITDFAYITEKSEINNHQSKESGTYMQVKVAQIKTHNARKCPKVGALSNRCLIDRQFAKCPNLGKWLIIMFFNTLYARGEA